MYKKFKKNDLVQLTHFCEVVKDSTDTTRLRDKKTGLVFDCLGETQNLLISCSDFSKEERVCRTTLADKLVNSNGNIFTAVFQKQNGESRVLRGHYLYLDKMMGRSHVWDLDKNSERQIDHRTISELIIHNTKFSLK